LRNAGITVRAAHVQVVGDLETQLPALTPDLIVVDASAAPPMLADVVQVASRGARDIAVIALLDALGEEAIAAALQEGAAAVALPTRADLFVAVIRREFASLTLRRRVRRLEASLRESERRCDALLDSSRDPIAIFGYQDFAQIEGVSLLDMLAAESAAEFKALLKNLSKGEPPPPSLGTKAKRIDGTTFDALVEFAAASFEGEPCQQIVLRRQTANADLAREIDALRSKDLITDLYNRQHGLAELERAVAAAAAGTPNQSLLLLEPDAFRKKLDTVGIGNADLLLGDIANLVRRRLDVGDYVAFRLSEHTFGILLRAHDTAATTDLANALRKAFEDHIFDIGKQSLGVGVSIGGVLIGEKNASVEALLNQAASALRQAQEQGGNRVDIVDPGIRERALANETRDMQKRVENAIANNGFSLYFQPVVSLHGAEGEFYEILLRMIGEKGELSPNLFFPAAEERGLLPAIDRWVISNAIRHLAERERSGATTTAFIKLTTASLGDPSLLAWIAQQLKTARLRGDALIFEMPESKVVTHLKPARAFVDGLKQLRCGFALEQFGAGVNSFQLLKHVDAGYLKIDRSYMIDLTRNKENQDFVRQFCRQAHQAGKLIVAEFVEDAASMSILFTCGVNFVQGNFLSEPEKVMVAGGAG
jgi:diguanylate cyclase (GGDEF)-like protein